MAYRSSSTSSAASGNPSVAVPAGVQSGDIVLLVATIDESGADFQTADWPTGFTELSEVDLTLDGQSAAIGWKRLTGADSGSYAFGTIGVGSTAWVCQAFAFSGRHATNPPVVSTAATSNAGNTSPVTVTANGVTAVAGDDLLWVSAPDVSTNNAGNGHTPPGSYTERQDAEQGFSNLSGATRDNVGAGATGTVAGTFALSSGTSGWAAWLVRIPAAPGGGQSAAVGQTTETDTAQALTEAKRKTAGQPSETDTAQAVARRKTRALGQTTETASAQPVTARKRRALGQPVETSSAQPVAWSPKRRLIGQAIEAGTAQPAAARKSRTVGQASEADTAQPVSASPKRRLVGQVTEAAAAQTLARRKSRTVGQPSEADTAHALTRRKIRALGQTTESDSAQTITPPGSLAAPVGQATETSSARPVTARTARLIGRAPETDTAQPATTRKSRTVGQASEADTAHALTRRKLRAVGQAAAVDLALPLIARKIRAIGLATENELAFALAARKTTSVGQATETNSTLALAQPDATAYAGWTLDANAATPDVTTTARPAGDLTSTARQHSMEVTHG